MHTAIEATPALAADFTAQVPPPREVVAAAAVETPAQRLPVLRLKL
ncbi:hypothetical protein [Kamptonema formosum]|nr:hypothetical protein [Oscillatoria sp. PCC 10802]